MERRPLDADNSYSLRQGDSYAVYDQTRSGQPSSNRSNYESMHRNGQSTYSREPVDRGQLVSARKVRTDNDQPERVYRPSARFATDETPDNNRQGYSSNHALDRSRINYTVPQNSRSMVLDINITINVGGNRNPQVTATTTQHISPPRSTAILEDIGFVDLDIRSPERTARLVTDGSIRSSPRQPSPK